MKKILLIFIFLSAGLFAKSPYSLEQITEHLESMYQTQLEQNATLKRWVEYEIQYGYFFTSTIIQSKQKEWEKQIDSEFKKVGKLIGKIFISDAKIPIMKKNIVFFYTSNFFKTFDVPFIQKWAFRTIESKVVAQHMIEVRNFFEPKDYRVYGINQDIVYEKDRHDGIYSFIHHLTEVDKTIFYNFNVFLRKDIMDILIIDSTMSGTIKSLKRTQGVIKSFYSKKYISNNQHWHKIDEYFLQALYNDKVKVGMPLNKAIPIMAKDIYSKFNKDK